MRIKIKSKDIDLAPFFKNWIERKLKRLEKFLRGFRSEIELEIEISKEGGDKEIFVVKGRMFLPKKDLYYVAHNDSLRQAVLEIIAGLEKEIKEYKERVPRSITLRLQRALKRLKINPAARFYRKGRIREEGR